MRFGLSHVRRALERNPAIETRLVAAVETRSARLAGMTGLDSLVTESLTLMAARSLQPAQLGDAARAVRDLQERMAANRVERLQAAGLGERTARYVSDLHTPNLM